MKRKGIKSKILNHILSLILLSFLVIGAVCFYSAHIILKEQAVSGEKQKLEQYVQHVGYIQETTENLARLVALDKTVQGLFGKNTEDSFSRLRYKDDLERKLTEYMLSQIDCVCISILGDSMCYSKERTSYDFENAVWYQKFKESGSRTGFAPPGNIAVIKARYKVDVLPYILTCYDATGKSSEPVDIVVEIRKEQFAQETTIDDGLVQAFLLYDGYGNLLSEKGKSTVAYKELPELKENGNTVVTELDNGNILLVNGSMKGEWRCVAEISVQSMNRKIGDSLKFIPICMGITGLLLLIILYQDVDRITRPLHKLSAASKCIGEGNLDTRVEINTTNEIQELGDTINTMAENLQRYIKKSIAYEKDMVNMEIDRLMLQINPHFIYNTLSTISYMAEEEGNDRIARFSNAFIALLQDTLRADTDNYFTTLQQEIKNVDNYVTLQKFKYEDKVEVFYEIPQELLECRVPNILLQPIVENALFHGIVPKTGPGMIIILAYHDKGRLCICVQDNGVGMGEENLQAVLQDKKLTTGTQRKIGVGNVRNRIQYIYGEEYGLEIKSILDVGTSVILRLPCEYEEKKENM